MTTLNDLRDHLAAVEDENAATVGAPEPEMTEDTRYTTPELAAIYRVAAALQGGAICQGSLRHFDDCLPDVQREHAADANQQSIIRAQAARELRRADGTLRYYQSIDLVQTLTWRQCVRLARKSFS
jgi:hypothetical protein